MTTEYNKTVLGMEMKMKENQVFRDYMSNL